jgi:hypothetical protein
VDLYPDVRLEWIRHHNPDLDIYDESGKHLQKIDLSRYDYAGLHELFHSHFWKKGDPVQQGRALLDDEAALIALRSENASADGVGNVRSPALHHEHHDADLPQPKSLGRPAADPSSSAWWDAWASMYFSLAMGSALALAVVAWLVIHRRRKIFSVAAKPVRTVGAPGADASRCV